MKGGRTAESTSAAVHRLSAGRARLSVAGARPAVSYPTDALSRLLLAALLGVLVLTCASIVLVFSSPAPTALQRVHDDAQQVLSMLEPAKRCAGLCKVQTLGRAAPGTWLVRLTTPHWQRCFLVTPDEFGYAQGHGINGLESLRCRQRSALATERVALRSSQRKNRAQSPVHFLNSH
jgi:hypothetical protein